MPPIANPVVAARRRALLTFVLTVALAACNGDDESPRTNVADAATLAALPDDATILGKLYGPGERAPDGFYVDPRDTSASGSFSVRHIDSASIVDPAVVVPEDVPYELCSDNVAEALDWSESAERYRAIAGDMIATVETPRYFEFVRSLSGLPDWVSYARVFKCSYLDRNGAVAGATDGPAGTLNTRPIDAATLKTLAEYLWTFSAFNNHAHAVIDSATGTSSAGLTHTLTLATLTPGAGLTTGCDRVELRDWELAVDAATGALVAELRAVGSFDARVDAGAPVRCD